LLKLSALISALLAAVLAPMALTGPPQELKLPFKLGKTYEYEISGEMMGREKFRILDATGPDGVKMFQLVSELDIKNQKGAFRKHRTSYVFDAYGRASSYTGWHEAQYPKAPDESGREDFAFTFLPKSVRAKVERKGRQTWEAEILNLPRGGVPAIDRDCISHLALALAGTSLAPDRRKDSVSLFSFKRRGERVRMSFDMVLTDRRRLWRKIEELGKVETDVYNVPMGTVWIRLKDRLLVKLANSSVTVAVELIPPE